MKDTKRLGPQNPLSWIKDSRESPVKHAKPGSIERYFPSEKQTYRFQSDGEAPVEVMVVMNRGQSDCQVKIEVAQKGKKAMKVEFETSNGKGTAGPGNPAAKPL